MDNSQLKTFINEGFYSMSKPLVNKNCSDLMKKISIEKSYSPSIFLDELEFKKNPNFKKTNPGPGVCNLAEKYNLDFIFKNPDIIKVLTKLLGKNYRTEVYKFVMGMPDGWIPTWVKKKMEDFGGSNNLNPYLKEKFRDVTCYCGAEYHQDSIDYSGHKALKSKSFLIMYVYFDKVTLNDAPIIVVPGSHLYGAVTFPHTIDETKNSINYSPKKNKNVNLSYKIVTGEAGTVSLWHSLTLHRTNVVKSKVPRISLKVVFEKAGEEECLMDFADQKIDGSLLLDNAFDKSTKLFSLAKKKYS